MAKILVPEFTKSYQNKKRKPPAPLKGEPESDSATT
jgi:hypothetical protein